MNTNPKKALFIGLTTIDIQYFVDHYPLPNTKIKTDAPLIAVGGPAANAAITFSALGGQADFLTCIGENSFSHLALEHLTRFNVNVTDCQQGVQTDPIVAAVITTISNSERTIFTHHPLEMGPIEPIVSMNLKDYGLIFIDGFYPELSEGILPLAKENNIPVIFDGGSWKTHLPELLNFVDIAICSGNFHPPGCKTDQEIVDNLKTFGINDVAISKGEKHIVCNHNFIQIEQVKAVDSLGAGDVLHGAFCYYWMCSFSFYEALTRASKVATFSVQHIGTHAWIKQYNYQQIQGNDQMENE